MYMYIYIYVCGIGLVFYFLIFCCMIVSPISDILVDWGGPFTWLAFYMESLH